MTNNTNEYENIHLNSEMPYITHAPRGHFGSLSSDEKYKTVTIIKEKETDIKETLKGKD